MQVTGQLWQLVVVHAELPAHLAALKNYFLLAKGDFYHSFLAEVNHDAQHRLLSHLLGTDKSNAQHAQTGSLSFIVARPELSCHPCMLKQPKQQQVVPKLPLPAAHQPIANMSVFWLSLTLSMFAAGMLCQDQCLACCQQA